MPVITGAASYPENLAERLGEICWDPILVDALTPAEEAGSAKAVNVVLLGILSAVLGAPPEETWITALTEHLKPALVEMNRDAFRRGRKMAKN